MMRLLPLILVLLMLLCGCTQESPNVTDPSEETTLPVTEATEQTASGTDVPDSEQKEDALLRYAVEHGCYGTVRVGEDFLLLSKQEGKGALHLYSGDTFELRKTAALEAGVFPQPEYFCAGEQGIAYYDRVDEAMVFMDFTLREIGRMQMPEQINGAGWLSSDWKTVYYCTDDGLFALDLQSGISRLLREQRSQGSELTAVFAGGKILCCTQKAADGQAQSFLLDASTGALLGEGSYFQDISIWSNRYFFTRYEGAILRLHFGIGEELSEIIWPKESGDAYPLLSDDAMVVVTPEQDGTTLTYYRLNAAKKIATIFLPEVVKVFDIRPDGWGGVWFVAEEASGAATLCQWDPSKSTIEDDSCYKTPCYTADNPDMAGIERMLNEAKALGERYGVDIRIWNEAAELAPYDHVFVAEHLLQAYEAFLPELEKALSLFPKAFYEKTGGDKKLTIAVVRSMTGDTEQGSLEKSTNLQYWLEKEPVIALAIDKNPVQNFCHAMAHLIDTQALSKSSAFYEWNTQNPEGFTYDNNYITNAARTDTTYIEGENRYFIDLFSMSYAKEDRARIFEYACMSGNEEIFQSPVLQEKLRRICKGIREAFGLKQYEEAFLWEQYLTT